MTQVATQRQVAHDVGSCLRVAGQIGLDLLSLQPSQLVVHIGVEVQVGVCGAAFGIMSSHEFQCGFRIGPPFLEGAQPRPGAKAPDMTVLRETPISNPASA